MRVLGFFVEFLKSIFYFLTVFPFTCKEWFMPSITFSETILVLSQKKEKKAF